MSELGRAQARQTGWELGDKGISVVYTSPFLRCLETTRGILGGMEERRAELAQEGGEVVLDQRRSMPGEVRVRVEEGLQEYLNPKWFPVRPLFTHHTRDTLGGLEPGHQSRLTPVYPETTQDMLERFLRMSPLLVGSHDEGDAILVVTHGCGVEGLAVGLLGTSVWEDFFIAEVGFCSLTEVHRREGRWTMGLTASTAHLDQPQ